MAATITIGVFILILSITTFSSSTEIATEPPSSSPPLTCTDELVMFSPCLPYVSAPPNNMSDTPSSLCCSVYSSSVNSSSGICFCYLLRQPLILGFPLDRSRVLSISQLCNDTSNGSLESLCSPSESPELPPLQSIQFTSPFVSGDTQSINSAPERAGMSPRSDQFSHEAATESPPSLPLPESISNGSPVIRNFWFLSSIILTLAT